MKKCSTCKKNLNDSEFVRPNGLVYNTCNSCSIKYAEYYQNNKEKIVEQNTEYYQNNKEKKAEYYQNNKEKIAEYRKTNKEKIAEYNTEYRKNNKEKIAERNAEWYQNNKEKIAERQVEYRKRKLKVESKMYKTLEDWLTVDDGLQPDSEGYATVLCYKCGKRFLPSVQELKLRKTSLQYIGFGERHFYCSQECKDSCVIFNQKEYPKGHKHYSVFRYARDEQWTKMVLERDNYTCQECGSTENINAHHKIPVIEEPMLASDVDNGITLCKVCHDKKHRDKEGCGYGELAALAKSCKKMYEDAV